MTFRQLYTVLLRIVGATLGLRVLVWIALMPYNIVSERLGPPSVTGAVLTVIFYVIGIAIIATVLFALFKWTRPLAKKLAGDEAESVVTLSVSKKEAFQIAIRVIGVYFALNGVVMFVGQSISSFAQVGVETGLGRYEITLLIKYGIEFVAGILLATYPNWLKALRASEGEDQQE
jgi:uncharacterized membrane protein